MSAPRHTEGATEAEREAFEAWAGSLDSWLPNIKRSGDRYVSAVTAAAWHAWERRASFPVGTRTGELTWREAIDEALIVNCIGSIGPDETPETALARLIQWEVQVALDPAVSSAATELVERGRVSRSASRQEGWQPIEMAPKDGTGVLLTNGKDVSQGWWVHEEPYIREQRDVAGVYIDQQEHDGFDGWMDCDGGMQPDPTHYMPLPPAPNQGDES